MDKVLYMWGEGGGGWGGEKKPQKLLIFFVDFTRTPQNTHKHLIVPSHLQKSS